MGLGRYLVALSWGVGLLTSGVASAGEAVRARSAGPGGTQETPLLADMLTWSRPLAGPGDDETGRIASDRAGGYLAVVNFNTGIDIGTGPLPGSTEAGVWNTVIARYDTQGKAQVLKTFDSAFTVRHAVDAQRNIVLIISTGGGVMEPGAHLAKLDPAGTLLWLRPLPESQQWPQVLTTDRDGNIGVGGFTRGSPRLSFFKYSPEGVRLWTFIDSQAGQSEARAATADADGNFYVVGSAMGTVSVVEPYLVKLSPDGQAQWRRRLTDSVGFGFDVATHGNRVVMVGTFGGAFQFAGSSHVAIGNLGINQDAFVAAWTRDGEERWAWNFAFDVHGVAMDEADGVTLVGGYQAASADLGILGPLAGNPSSAANVYVAKFDRLQGDLRWVQGFPSGPDLSSPGLDEGSVAVTKDGRAAVLGLFHGTLQVGAKTWSAKGRSDLFLFGFAP
ncbi:hypothetical protein LZ198_07255 [Myxococcus sp. K15C18031901]|uniref:hypothetical protein n=1 Tax=Myxococcus dinghuensis TaxID=2906761 RepID=UPI0020A78FAA|nr:hypothetical protein [Myxococcus dinghuensis]MCP3098672.1 hypothetical protein [Myxococcus dinghuensis]